MTPLEASWRPPKSGLGLPAESLPNLTGPAVHTLRIEGSVMAVADPLNVAVRLANKIACDIPRNLDIAMLRHTIHQLAAQRPTAVLVRKRRRRIVPAGYWALRKRIQRARIRAAKAATEAPG